MDAVRNLFPESEQAEGLSSAEARVRLEKEGYNELPSTGQRSTLNIVLGVTREPMFLLLIVSVTIYLALGDVREALVLALSLFVIFGITIFQERKTERALEALRDLSSPRALVIRDGEQQRIAGREVVRDDILILTEGDRVPADAVLLSCNDLMWTSHCSRENPFRFGRLPGTERRKPLGPAVTTYPSFIPAPCWYKAVVPPESWQRA